MASVWLFFGPLRGAFWAPAARPTWSLGTFCSGFPAPAPPNPDLTNLLDPPNLHTGFYLYLSAYEVLAAGELAPGLAAGELAPGLAAGQLAPGLAAGKLGGREVGRPQDSPRVGSEIRGSSSEFR